MGCGVKERGKLSIWRGNIVMGGTSSQRGFGPDKLLCPIDNDYHLHYCKV